MAQTKKIDRGRWSEFLSTFSNGNRGRSVSIELVGMEVGDQPLVEAAPLLAIDYDPERKGDNLVISTGREVVDYTHTINGPTEIWEAQGDEGEVQALEIIDRSGLKTILSFKS
jgi:hypothetical protein